MSELPIFEVLDGLRSALSNVGAAVLIAPPGAGKTTAVPLALMNEPWLNDKKIIMLEPRRLAARTAARTMAKTLNERVGDTVGYRMRLDNKVSKNTRIEIVTEGVFQRMIVDDPELSGIGCVVFDEFHERSLDADFGLALTLEARSVLRADLRLLVMSATLDGARIAELMGDAPQIVSRGRMFDVDIRYAPRAANEKIENAMAACVRRLLRDEQDSILCFLPGQGEIRRTQELLNDRLPSSAFIAPLFGAMDIGDQAKAIEPPPKGMRKIVLATSIAETSITIDGVHIVVDSGLTRAQTFEPALGISRLETRRASKASITQRAGRAGRTAPGIAVRLWSEPQTTALAEFDPPEIFNTDLTSLILNSANWGAPNIQALALLDQPPSAHVVEATKLLQALDALDENGKITSKGKAICGSGLEPRLASMILSANTPQARAFRAFLALLISERGVGGAHVDIAERFDRALVEKTNRASQLRKLAVRISSGGRLGDGVPDETAGEMLCDAFPDRIAKQRGRPGSYTMVNGRGVGLDETNPMANEPYIVVADMTGSAKDARVLSAAPLDEKMLLDRFADNLISEDKIELDRSSGRLTRTISRKLGTVTFAAQNAPIVAGEETSKALIAAIKSSGLDVLKWPDLATSLRNRIAWLYTLLGSPWRDMGDDALTGSVDHWLGPFLTSVTQLDQIDGAILQEALLSLLPYEQRQELDRLAPNYFQVPTGSKIKLHYSADTGPILSVRVQEVFGLTEHPTIAGGRHPLTVELLSPAQRPIQTTTDLPAFWQGSWRDVRSEMRGRYPRHEWPEQPANAAPTRRAKPRK